MGRRVAFRALILRLCSIVVDVETGVLRVARLSPQGVSLPLEFFSSNKAKSRAAETLAESVSFSSLYEYVISIALNTLSGILRLARAVRPAPSAALASCSSQACVRLWADILLLSGGIFRVTFITVFHCDMIIMVGSFFAL